MTGGKSKQTGHSKGATCHQKIFKTKRKRACLDEAFHAVVAANANGKLPEAAIDTDLPGEGQFKCIPCDRHFQDAHSRREHLKTKLHKRRMKSLQVTPYSIEEAEAAGGIGTYCKPEAVVVEDPHRENKMDE